MSLTKDDIFIINSKRLAKYGQKYYYGDKIYIGQSDGTLSIYIKQPSIQSIKIIENYTIFNFESEDDSIINTISDLNLRNDNLKGFTFVPIETKYTSLDDFKLAQMSFNIENIIDQKSFDIRATAVNNATGLFKIKYIIYY